jgi:hypothetical protein
MLSRTLRKIKFFGFYNEGLSLFETQLSIIFQMINSISLTRLSNSELLGFFQDLNETCIPFNPQKLGFDSKLKELNAFLVELSEIYQQETGSPLSPNLEKLDQRRDKAISGIKMYVESLALHYREDVVAASYVVLEAITKYGENIAAQNFITETNTLAHLSNDFDTDGPLKEAIKIVNLVEWTAELKIANLSFNEVYLERNKQTGQNPEGTFTEKKGDGIEIYEALTIAIKSLYVVNGGSVLSGLIREINTVIAKYNRIITSGIINGEEVPA